MMGIYASLWTSYNRSTVEVRGLDTTGPLWTSFNGSTT